MEFLRIAVLGVGAAVAYGIVHDQVTVRVCLEYFTLAHPPLVPTNSPTLVALAWGVVATWWVGLPLGLGLGAAARVGRRPQLTSSELARPVGILLALMASSALLAGFTGWIATRAGWYQHVWLLGGDYPINWQARFAAAAWAHSASYLSGIIGGLGLIALVLLRRTRVDAGGTSLDG